LGGATNTTKTLTTAPVTTLTFVDFVWLEIAPDADLDGGRNEGAEGSVVIQFV